MLDDLSRFLGFRDKEGRKLEGELINSSFFNILL
jgi:hypothetical protein